MRAWILAALAATTLAGCSTPQHQPPGENHVYDKGPQPGQQQPFICRTEESGLGQPLVDNQQGIGHPVRDAGGAVIGYSSQCAIRPR